MAFDRDRDFSDVEDAAASRYSARRVAFIGIPGMFILGFALIMLLMYGRILIDNSVADVSAPRAVAASKAEAPVTPAARAANSQ